MSVKRALESKTSPLRTVLEDMLPDLGPAMRGSWKQQMSGAQAVFDEQLPADVLGHVISERVAGLFAGNAGAFPGALALGIAGVGRGVIADLAREAGQACEDPRSERAARVACLTGLADRAYRSGRTAEPWYEQLRAASSLQEALAVVDPAWVADVTAVSQRAARALGPLAGATPAVRGPSFAGSRAAGGADGDLILGRVLVEVKTSRLSELRKRDVQQVMAYALLDWEDEYGLEEVALLSARHGVLVRWPLRQLVGDASRSTVDLEAARARLREALA